MIAPETVLAHAVVAGPHVREQYPGIIGVAIAPDDLAPPKARIEISASVRCETCESSGTHQRPSLHDMILALDVRYAPVPCRRCEDRAARPATLRCFTFIRSLFLHAVPALERYRLGDRRISSAGASVSGFRTNVIVYCLKPGATKHNYPDT